MPNKSYTVHDLKPPRVGWDYFEGLFRHRITYRVDVVNFALVTGAETPFQLRRQCIAKMKRLPGDGWAMSYVDIYRTATSYGAVPEFLVNEAHYQRQCGMLPYRLAFAALRKGMDLWSFYLKLLEAGRPLSPWTFYGFIEGRRKDVRYVGMDTVEDMCRLVGMELADLFTPKFRRVAAVGPVYEMLLAVVGMLDDADMAALAGIAAALAKHKDAASTLAEIGRVLEWREEVKERAVADVQSGAGGSG